MAACFFLLGRICLQSGQQFLAAGQGLRIRVSLRVGGEFEQTGDLVAAGQQQLDQLAVHLDAAVPGAVQGVFQDVGEVDDIVALDDARPALDGVGGAKDRIEGVVVRRILLQAQEIFIQAGEEFLAFRDIRLS